MPDKCIKSHINCEDCKSSDARSIYKNENNGHTYSFCFSCGKRRELTKHGKDNMTEIFQIPDKFDSLAERSIAKEAAKKFSVFKTKDKRGKDVIVYPRFDKEGNHVGNKVRLLETKEFFYQGKTKDFVMFGQNLFPPGCTKTITLVEGQDDAMAVYEMMGNKWPVISVDAASTATIQVAHNFEYLNSFDNIVVCFDRDEAKIKHTGEKFYPGQEAAIGVANQFEVGKIKLLTLKEFKDANDYLMNGAKDLFIKEWWQAPIYKPASLKTGKELWNEVITPIKYESCSYPWKGLQYMTYGLRLSELVILTADTGVGKTSIFKEIEHHILQTTERNVGLLHLEEANRDSVIGLMSVAASIPLHLPDVWEGVSKEDKRNIFNEYINNDRIVLWDHFGANDIYEVLGKIRHMHNLGCKYIFIDHLSIIVSDQQGDERKQLDEIATKLKSLCMELNICIVAAIHQNRSGTIRGSAGPEQLANLVLKLYRDKQDPDKFRRNVTKVIVEKNRFCGRTGPAVYLYYEEGTGRLSELEDEDVKVYEEGGTPDTSSFI